MAKLADTELATNNLSAWQDLQRKANTIESLLAQWVAEADALTSAVDTEDEPTIDSLRVDLRARLNAAAPE